MYCKNCKKAIDNSFNYCPYCTTKINKNFKLDKFSIFIIIMFLLVFLTLFTWSFIELGILKIPNVKYISLEDYKKISSEYGCSVIDMKNNENYSDFDTYLVTDSNTCPYVINYIIIDDSKTRKKVYSNFVYELNHENGDYLQTVSINVPKYTRNSTTGTYYLDAIMVDNEIITMSTTRDNKSNAQLLEEKLGIENYKINYSSKYFMICYMYVFVILIYIFLCWWKLNIKLGRKGYICLIPIYNLICLSNDVFNKKWLAILFLIPFVNYIMFLLLLVNLLKKYNKNSSYIVIGIFFPLVLMTLLSFDTSY